MTGQAESTSILAATVLDAALIASIHVASWRETYARVMPEAMLERILVQDRAERWTRILADNAGHGGASAFIAQHDRQSVGFASCCAQRDESLASQSFTGEISAIYVLRAAQGRGIGSALMAAAARRLSEVGHRGASLWVLRDNHRAQRFYQRLGGTPQREREDLRENLTFVEVAYGWCDLSELF